MLDKILVLEDNQLLAETLEEYLSDNNYMVKIATRGEEALNLCFNEHFNLFLLDVKVPDISGFDFLKEMRSTGFNTPAIFLTSLRDKESLQKGFELGGDDYIKKPFELDELLYRVKAVLARGKEVSDMIKIDKHFNLDKKRKRLLRDGIDLALNLKDFELLELLVLDRGKVITIEMIIDKLWKNEVANIGSIRVYVTNLKKIFGKDSISNIRGVGYRFEK
ncbi:MAG: response regulator transcription factor [Epsilonproteobacteria bacterium]|nr:response regulator transcription factor [Campylobacterota bacterium]